MIHRHNPEQNAVKARQLLSRSQVLMLDFDGPICSVFANHPANYVANQLRHALANSDRGDLPPEVAKTEDPFVVFNYAATLGDQEAHIAEAALRKYEIEAVADAQPTPGAHELILSWSAGKKRVAVVSNNSDTAVRAYLDHHDLTSSVSMISARIDANPNHLKPGSHLIGQVLKSFDIPANRCTLVGDSSSDIVAAHRLGVSSIGYANKTSKLALLANFQPSAIIDSITDLLYP